MSSKYAEKTNVSSEKSRSEIERTLSRYGAAEFLYGWSDDKALVAFTMNDRKVKFQLSLPDKGNKEISKTDTGRKRNVNQIEIAYEQAVRQRWRALALVIKAKLEAVESGITVFEDEFMAHIVLPNGSTVGEFMKPQIKKSYETKEMPLLLPGITQ